ncbi:MAG TPA: non-ribosomal peptide synthetase [Candidatus Sulfotelmatobacter sp.]|nr:non-ribosomal peptide synthetase [Candidatus Sulfotelmatobacter sp.]
MSDGMTTMEAGEKSLVAQWVAAQAQARPHAAALVAGSTTLTYAELDRRANQFANYLVTLGVGPDKLVALCMQRSPEMVVAALGILRAGGAYLPLDPSAPPERMELMLRDANVVVLVTDQSSRTFPAAGFKLVDVKKDAGTIAGCSAEAPTISITPQNLAYVIYTSGSTGQPKGVEVTHCGLTNLVRWHLRAFEVTEADRASQQAALGFDAAVWELWPYLAAGASVYFPEDGVRNDPEALRGWLVANKITITFLATPLAERMMLLDWPRPADLRILLTGADTLHRRPSSRLPFALVNNYGPTECTVVATSGVVAPAESSSEPLTIGRAIDNTEVFVLDEHMQRVPAGKPGELYIGGAGLARGYRKRPEVTAQRFVANPFASSSDERLYRTGDLVRELPNGELEFLGRLDTQIKIRGYRVEPNEIVRVLDACPEVEASVVQAAEDESGDKRLVAYVVLAASANGTTAAGIRAMLRKQLPDYMIPAAFVRITTLPITSNGKVDTAALPLPKNGNMLEDEHYVAPRSVVDQRLAAIIAPLLHVERVGLHDNFFFMGGHSLLGTQLISKISETFGVELSLLNLFEHPTLAEMSQEIEQLILAKVGPMESESETEYVSPTPRRGDAA